MENIKEIIAKNLVQLRKSRKYTQQALAEKLNYSDKAISRWEHAETLPDIETLCKICDLYGVKFEYLLQKEQPEKKNPYIKRDDTPGRVMITLIAVCAVWLTASLIFTYTYEKYNLWTVFIWALPVTGFVCSVCNRVFWQNKIFGAISSSFISWTIILSIYLQFIEKNMWMLFIIGVPIQLIIIFAATLKRAGAHHFGERFR